MMCLVLLELMERTVCSVLYPLNALLPLDAFSLCCVAVAGTFQHYHILYQLHRRYNSHDSHPSPFYTIHLTSDHCYQMFESHPVENIVCPPGILAGIYYALLLSNSNTLLMSIIIKAPPPPEI